MVRQDEYQMGLLLMLFLITCFKSYGCFSSLVFISVIITMTKSNSGEERVYSNLHFRVLVHS